MPQRLPEMVHSVLDEARQAHIAVEPASGPHITPALYAWSGGEVWLAGAATTLKARTLALRPVAGVAVRAGGRTVVLSGPVRRFDPLHLGSLARSIGEAPVVLRAMLGYGVRNVPDLLGFARDLGRGRLGLRLPPRRSVFAVHPERGALVEDGIVTCSWGGWMRAEATSPGDALLDGRSVVVGLPGPLALPARIASTGKHLSVSPDLVPMIPSRASFSLAWVSDAYMAPGPAAKRGRMGRGLAHLTDVPGRLRLEVDRLVEWEGVETSTTRIGKGDHPAPIGSAV